MYIKETLPHILVYIGYARGAFAAEANAGGDAICFFLSLPPAGRAAKAWIRAAGASPGGPPPRHYPISEHAVTRKIRR